MKEKKFTGIIMIVIAIILLSYTALDAFKIRPGIKKQVEHVSYEFVQLKTYLDTKIPEIDSVLIIHTRQIEEQNSQLKELNTLTSVLKEK